MKPILNDFFNFFSSCDETEKIADNVSNLGSLNINNVLPVEIIDKIFDFLDFDDILNAREVLNTYYYDKDNGVIIHRTISSCILNYNIDNIKWLIRRGQVEDYYNSLRLCIEMKCVLYFKLIEENTPSDYFSDGKFYQKMHLFYNSVRHSVFEIIEWIFENWLQDSQIRSYYIYEGLSRGMEFSTTTPKVYDYLYDKLDEETKNLEENRTKFTLNIIRSDNLVLLEHVVNNKNFLIPEEALEVAASGNNRELLLYILNLGIGDLQQGMYHAGISGNLENLELIFEHLPEEILENSEIPETIIQVLVEVSSEGDYDTVDWIIQRYGFGDQYSPALLGAVKSGHYDIVQLLLDNGSDVNFGEGEILEAAINEKDLQMVKILLNEQDLEIHDWILETACYNNSVDIVKLLLDCNYTFSDPETTINECLLRGTQSDIVLFLLELHSEIENIEIYSSSFWATVENERFHIAKIILDKGCKPRYLDNTTAVNKLIQFNHFDLFLKSIDIFPKIGSQSDPEENEKYDFYIMKCMMIINDYINSKVNTVIPDNWVNYPFRKLMSWYYVIKVWMIIFFYNLRFVKDVN